MIFLPFYEVAVKTDNVKVSAVLKKVTLDIGLCDSDVRSSYVVAMQMFGLI